jgi:hypothetical protein
MPHTESPKAAKRPSPTSLRLSAAERAVLVERANGVPLSAYIKHVLFGEDAPILRRQRPATADQALLAKVLAALGASRLASNLNQLAKEANIGTLPVTQETEDDLRRACGDIAEMRALLMTALGIQKSEPVSVLSALRPFNRAAGDGS